MSDYRNPDLDPFSPDDPARGNAGRNAELRPSNVVTGWIVATVFVVALGAIVFGISHQRPGGPTTASNDTAQRGVSPAMTHMAPTPVPTTTPAPQPTASPLAPTKPPISPVPPGPGQSSGAQ